MGNLRCAHPYPGECPPGKAALPLIDYGARMYDPAVARWMSVDPLADHPKQINVTPYVFTINNPIRYTDPTGLIWQKPKQAKRLVKEINTRINQINANSEKLQAKINNGNLNDKRLLRAKNQIEENSKKNDLLNQSLSDIKTIENAKETYRLTGPSASDGTHGVVKGSDEVIRIEGSTSAIHIHEIRHIGQSIKSGGLKFNKEGRLLNAARVLDAARKNEIEAYQTQYSFDGTYPGRASSLKDINSTSLLNIKTPDGRLVYDFLRDCEE